MCLVNEINEKVKNKNQENTPTIKYEAKVTMNSNAICVFSTAKRQLKMVASWLGIFLSKMCPDVSLIITMEFEI